MDLPVHAEIFGQRGEAFLQGVGLGQGRQVEVHAQEEAPAFLITELLRIQDAAAQLVQGIAAFPLVTIGVTNTEVTSNSDADDGAAAV